MFNKKFIIIVIISLYTLGINKSGTAHEVKRLVFENMNSEIQDKLENGQWGDSKEDYWNYSLTKIFTILDFEKKQIIMTGFTAMDNSIFNNTMEIKDLIIDVSKFPFITAKFKTNHKDL